MHAAGLHGQRVRQAPGRVRQPADRQHRHPVRARGAPERAGHRRSSSSTSTRRSAASTTTATRPRNGSRPIRSAWSAPTGPARSTRRTTSTRSRSSTCAGPTPVPSTTCTAPTRCGRGCCATSAPPPTRCCGAARCPLIGDPAFADQAILALDRWLARVEADRRSVGLARKILENRPDTVTDRCTDGLGHDVPAEVCDQTVAAYGTPRMAAGGPLADDTLQCQLKPLARADYDVTFTDAQWARLRATFPNGVCDYTRPGVSPARRDRRGSPTRTPPAGSCTAAAPLGRHHRHLPPRSG